MTDQPLPVPAAPTVDPTTETVADADRRRRAWILTWLAGIFAAPPTRDLVAAYRRGEAALVLEELAGDADLAPGIAAMSAALDTPLDDEAMTARLGTAFGRLFLGIGGPETVSPYESVHRDGGRLYGAPVGEMTALLAAHDLTVAEATREPPDHLAIELTLLARLITADHPDRAALRARLTAWVPTFCELCVARDISGFFAGAAAVLLAALERESRDVDVAPL